MVTAAKPLPLGQFLSLPAEEPPLEFADGVVTQKVSSKGHHSALRAELIKKLDEVGLPAKVARAFPELRASFGGVSRVPDIAVYREEGMSGIRWVRRVRTWTRTLVDETEP